MVYRNSRMYILSFFSFLFVLFFYLFFYFFLIWFRGLLFKIIITFFRILSLVKTIVCIFYLWKFNIWVFYLFLIILRKYLLVLLWQKYITQLHIRTNWSIWVIHQMIFGKPNWVVLHFSFFFFHFNLVFIANCLISQVLNWLFSH